MAVTQHHDASQGIPATHKVVHLRSEPMASTDDTQRAAIRERKRQAHAALRERHQRQEAAQTAAFSALDRLARQLDQGVKELAADGDDPLERAAAITMIAAQLTVDMDDVRRTANELVATASMTQAEVAELLGTRTALLFPRPRTASRSARPVSPPPSNTTPTEVVA